MCCGQIEKPNKNRQYQAPPVQVQQSNNEAVPAQVSIVNDNVNSQRAAIVTRNNYHRLRFWRG